MRKATNSERIEGRVYQNSLTVKTVQNQTSANYGKEFISGDLEVAVDEKSYASECLKYIMHELIKSSYSSVASGATFAELKLFVLRELKTILPPLSLQQLFAKKIEAIEKQKALIKQSIAETEELFNSRMDYYFS